MLRVILESLESLEVPEHSGAAQLAASRDLERALQRAGVGVSAMQRLVEITDQTHVHKLTGLGTPRSPIWGNLLIDSSISPWLC